MNISRPQLRSITLLSSLCLCWLGAGCTDPQGRYDAFIERTADARALDAGAGVSGARFDWSGRYLLGLSTSLSPAQPILFEVDASVANDLETADLVIYPLSTDDDAEPRTPLGDDIGVSDVVYDVDGRFVVDLGEVTIPGRANPISGSEIVATVQLAGRTIADDALVEVFCGVVTGMVTMPVTFDLAGSTFGAVESAELDAAPSVRCPAMD